MVRTPGTRVYAIQEADDDTVRAFGEGVYIGDEIPPADGLDAPQGWIADTIREHGHTNPKILLDSGVVVWGCECWWGCAAPEQVIRGRKVEMVDIRALREKTPRGDDIRGVLELK